MFPFQHFPYSTAQRLLYGEGLRLVRRVDPMRFVGFTGFEGFVNLQRRADLIPSP